jgi:hypothetical protein
LVINKGARDVNLKQAQAQLAQIEREIAAYEADTSERGKLQASVHVPKMRAALEHGRAWIAKNFPDAA